MLPDGCTDILVQFCRAGSSLPQVDVVGPTERGEVFEMPHSTTVIGVRLCPEAAGRLLRTRLPDMFGRQVPVGDCAPHLGRLPEMLAASSGTDATVAVLIGAVANAARAESRAVGVSERTLHREVKAATGFAPKTLARVFRFQRALQVIRCQGVAGLCGVAIDCGYADQSHMTRDFRELAGLPPAALAAD